MEVLYVWTISGVHEHLYHLRAITKTWVSERRHMGSSITQVPQNIGIACSNRSLGECTAATLPTSAYYLHLSTLLR